MEATIPFYPLIVAPLAGAGFAFWRRFRLHLAVIGAGRPLERTDRPLERIRAVVLHIFGHQRLLRDPGPGLMHAAIFWAFVVLLATSGNYLTNGLVEAVIGFPFGGLLWGLVLLAANLVIGAALLAIGYALWRRLIARPPRLALTRDAFVILGLIAAIVTSEIVGDAFGYVVEPDDPSRPFAILSNLLSLLLGVIGPGVAALGYGVVGWAHIVLVLAFGAYLPYSKHLHILTSEPNVYFGNLEPRGALRKMDLETEGTTFGAGKLGDLSWRHLLDGFACTECGRCMEFCPASMTGKVLSPKHLMEGLRDQMVAAETALAAAASAQRAAKGGANGGAEASDHAIGLARRRATEALELPLVNAAIPEEAVWQCVTCGWCVEACPVLIEHVDTIVEIRRNLVLEEASFPRELNAAFRNMETAGNPWGQPRSARLDWAKGLGVTALDGATAAAPAEPDRPAADGVLLWIGCAGAFDERNRKVARATVQLLRQAQVPFTVLGPRETCTGDPARRAGNEYLYQMLAEENVATLSAVRDEHGIKTVAALCPHCFNMLRNEYPQLGLDGLEVIHHSQLLERLVDEGRLRPTFGTLDRRVAFHDPCYLGRYNRVFDAPRQLVEAVPGQRVVEMELHHERGMCCGAGGARMWMEEREGQRINHRRTQQALETGADTIATACPYCLIMLRDGTTDLGRTDVEVRDVAELLADATGAWSSTLHATSGPR